LTLKPLPATNVDRKGIRLVSAKINTKLYELQINEDIINQIQNLYIEASNKDSSPSDTSEENFQIDELATSNSNSDTFTNSKKLNVLTRDQEFILEAIKRLDDPRLEKTI